MERHLSNGKRKAQSQIDLYCSTVLYTLDYLCGLYAGVSLWIVKVILISQDTTSQDQL